MKDPNVVCMGVGRERIGRVVRVTMNCRDKNDTTCEESRMCDFVLSISRHLLRLITSYALFSRR